MPRITRVAKAQQRYATVPVIDEATGEPKQTPVCHAGTLVQKTTKTGHPVFMAVTRPDPDQPLSPYECDYVGCPYPDKVIAVGTAYKHMTVKTGPSSSRKYTRHDACPDWQVWDYSDSLSARLAHIVFDVEVEVMAATEQGEVESAFGSATEQIREIAEEKREAAQNIEDGFGVATSASEELTEQAESLDAWADEIDAIDVPEKPDCDTCEGEGKHDCETCGGAGEVEESDDDDDDDDDDDECPDCAGECRVTCEDCDGEGVDEETWREEINSQVEQVADIPV